MRISPEGLKIVQSAESFEPRPYFCQAGVATVGFGHLLLDPQGRQIRVAQHGRVKGAQLMEASMLRELGKPSLTLAEANELLDRDLDRYEARVNRHVDAKTYQCEFDAMVSLCFNIGEGNFESSSVARLHKAGVRKVGDISLSNLAALSQAKANPVNMPIAFVRWAIADSKWSKGLFRRRIAELLVYSGRPAEESLKIGWSYGT